MSGPLPADWYRDKETIQRVVEEYGSFRATADATGSDRNSIAKWWRRHELPPRPRAAVTPIEKVAAAAPGGIDEASLLKALKRAGEGASVSSLADVVDASPRRVQTALTALSEKGYRVDLADDQAVRLDRVPPSKTGVYPDMLPLLDGKTIRFGVVSDTHISSIEEALPELHAAYDYFAREGITTVLHAGDWTCGYGIYPQQISEVKEATATGQADRLRAEYPQRPGIRTIGIGGNHDLEGTFGRAGYDPVAAAFRDRDDITYLGGYDAFLQVGVETLGPDVAPWVNLRHGKGGMSYAYSYKAQKLVEGIPSGRKPAIFIPGHWHVQASFQVRGVQVLFPGCFEWASTFMRRLGLQPAVGFHVVEATIAADGSLVGYLPRWIPMWEGRVVS